MLLGDIWFSKYYRNIWELFLSIPFAALGAAFKCNFLSFLSLIPVGFFLVWFGLFFSFKKE